MEEGGKYEQEQKNPDSHGIFWKFGSCECVECAHGKQPGFL